MKLKNLSNRNISLIAPNMKVKDKDGNEGFVKGNRVLVIAKSTLELDDSKYREVQVQAKELVEAGVLEVVKAPNTKMTKDEIIAKVMLEADIELKSSLSLAKLQEKAEKLGVEV